MSTISKREYNANLRICDAAIRNLAQLFSLNSEEIAIVSSYYPSYDEVKDCTHLILKNYIYDSGVTAEPVPKLSLNLSPPASGKSNLNKYSMKKMGSNVVLVNSDDLKCYYSKARDLATDPKYSMFYSYVTDIMSNIATSVLLNTCFDMKLNCVFEGTGKTNRIINTIEPINNIYRIKIRTIAVSAMTSLVSIMCRYTEQKMNGLNGRLVRAEDFLKCFSNLPTLLDIAERNNGYHVEVFTRGKDSQMLPIKLYSSNDRSGFSNSVAALQSAREYNSRVTREENLLKIGEVYTYLRNNNNVENTLVLTELINILYNVLLLDNSHINDDF